MTFATTAAPMTHMRRPNRPVVGSMPIILPSSQYTRSPTNAPGMALAPTPPAQQLRKNPLFVSPGNPDELDLIDDERFSALERSHEDGGLPRGSLQRLHAGADWRAEIDPYRWTGVFDGSASKQTDAASVVDGFAPVMSVPGVLRYQQSSPSDVTVYALRNALISQIAAFFERHHQRATYRIMVGQWPIRVKASMENVIESLHYATDPRMDAYFAIGEGENRAIRFIVH